MMHPINKSNKPIIPSENHHVSHHFLLLQYCASVCSQILGFVSHQFSFIYYCASVCSQILGFVSHQFSFIIYCASVCSHQGHRSGYILLAYQDFSWLGHPKSERKSAEGRHFASIKQFRIRNLCQYCRIEKKNNFFLAYF